MGARTLLTTGRAQMNHGHAVIVDVADACNGQAHPQLTMVVWPLATCDEHDRADMRSTRMAGQFLVLDSTHSFHGEFAWEVYELSAGAADSS